MITFIYVIEPGRIEKEALLSIHSLRTFGGKYKTAPIFCFCPRPNKVISQETLDLLKKWKVDFFNEDINTKYIAYPLANKPLSCKAAVKYCTTRYLTFMDSDTIFLNEPEILVSSSHDIKIGNVVVQNIGTRGPKSRNFEYWQTLYDKYNITNKYQTTSLSNEESIYGYWNTGVVSVKRDQSIFEGWEETFVDMMDHDLTPPGNLYMLEQASMAITIMRMNLSVLELPHHYNYHISAQNLILEKYKCYNLSEITIMHYHAIFRFSHFFHPLNKILESDYKSEWVRKHVRKYGLFPLPFKTQGYNLLGNFYYRKIKMPYKRFRSSLAHE